MLLPFACSSVHLLLGHQHMNTPQLDGSALFTLSAKPVTVYVCEGMKTEDRVVTRKVAICRDATYLELNVCFYSRAASR